MSIERLRALEKAVELVAKATPGPWMVSDHNEGEMHPLWCVDNEAFHTGGDEDQPLMVSVQYGGKEDAEAIRAAVNFIREHGSALIAELGQEVAPVSAPEGWALVPKQMALTPEALGLIETMCAGPDNEGIGGEGGEDRWVDGLLWVGETIGDDGEKYWGLNIACAECLDEGSLPIFEFDRPTSPAHTSEARDAASTRSKAALLFFAKLRETSDVHEADASVGIFEAAWHCGTNGLVDALNAALDAGMRQEAE